jgi:hypothetical protein
VSSTADRESMLAILRRVADADAGAPLDPGAALAASLGGLGLDEGGSGGEDETDEEEDTSLDLGGGCVLSAATAARARAAAAAAAAGGPPLDGAALEALLTPDEVAAFEAAAGAGAVRVAPWAAWWASRGALPPLAADGTAALAVVGGTDAVEDGTGPPPPPSTPLPSVASLTGGRPPSPAVAGAAAAALYAYAWALRRSNGDWAVDPGAFAGALVAVAGLGERGGGAPPAVGAALRAAVAAAASHPDAPGRSVADRRGVAVACLDDVAALARCGRAAGVRALADAGRVVAAAKAARAAVQAAAPPAPTPDGNVTPVGRLQALRYARALASAAVEGRPAPAACSAPPPPPRRSGLRSAALAAAAARLRFLTAWANEADGSWWTAVADAARAELLAAAAAVGEGGGAAADRGAPAAKPRIQEL